MAMVDESARMMAAANPGLQSAVADEDKCDTCKLIVTQVATMLRNPVSTRHTIAHTLLLLLVSWAFCKALSVLYCLTLKPVWLRLCSSSALSKNGVI